MNAKIEAAITILTNKVTSSITPEEALKFTQAALNLAHTQAILSNLGQHWSALRMKPAEHYGTELLQEFWDEISTLLNMPFNMKTAEDMNDIVATYLAF